MKSLDQQIINTLLSTQTNKSLREIAQIVRSGTGRSKEETARKIAEAILRPQIKSPRKYRKDRELSGQPCACGDGVSDANGICYLTDEPTIYFFAGKKDPLNAQCPSLPAGFMGDILNYNNNTGKYYYNSSQTSKVDAFKKSCPFRNSVCYQDTLNQAYNLGCTAGKTDLPGQPSINDQISSIATRGTPAFSDAVNSYRRGFNDCWIHK